MDQNPDALAEMPLPFLLDEAPTSAPIAGKQPSYIVDHRQRLRARFMQGGPTAMPDYELLELVLFRAIPRRDVKPLAHALMDRFGDNFQLLTINLDAPEKLAVAGIELSTVSIAPTQQIVERYLGNAKSAVYLISEPLHQPQSTHPFGYL